MARRRRLHRRYGNGKRRNPESSPKRSNPTALSDILEFVGPGFAAFAATRMLTRMASVQIAKRKPTWGKHAGALASVGSFFAAWWGAHRVKFLEKHHTPIVVGSAIAAIQSLVQLYIPKLGWILADASPDLATEAQTAQQLNAPPMSTAQAQIASGKLAPVDDDPSWYTFDDKYDAGRYAKDTGGPAPVPSGTARKVAADDDLLADLNLDDDSAQNMGIFSN
jgi:hypothetical protein